MTYNYCVIGGGIVGLSVAMQVLQRRPGASVVVLEKEHRLGAHQTGHNSGVIHSGIYYAPASLKATLCREGASETKRFAAEHGIPVETCGKLLVATSPQELHAMDLLRKQAAANGVVVEDIDGPELARREPAIRGLGALFVPETAIVDYGAISIAMAEVVQGLGGEIELGIHVNSIRESPNAVAIGSVDRIWSAERLVVCGGLQADRLARLSGLHIDFHIVPFRGEYYRVRTERKDIVKHLIYPIPDPDIPFLGIHLTRTIDGGITVGPNAVLGMAREGYSKFSFSARDVRDYLTFPGMWHVARKNIRTGARELANSLFKWSYLAQCRKYCPELTRRDLRPEPAGIRAQAVTRDGTLVHDFLFVETDRMLHVCNAPSPAATSAIPIGRMIFDRLSARSS